MPTCLWVIAYLTQTWLEHFTSRLMKTNENGKNLQTNLLWTYDLNCSINF
jgi:hypothetical protein